MSYAMFILSFADLLVTNSGPNACENRKITIRQCRIRNGKFLYISGLLEFENINIRKPYQK